MEAAAWRSYARGGWVVDAKGIGKQRWHEDSDPMVAAMAPAIQNGVVRELQRIALYEGRLTRELQRLKAELKEMQAARGLRERIQAEQARREAAEQRRAQRAAAPPATDPPLPATGKVSMTELSAWSKRERARLDAEALAFHAARSNPAESET